MKFSILTTFILLVLSHTANIASAAAIPGTNGLQQQCAQPVTVTVSNVVTKTVTVNKAGSTSAADKDNDSGKAKTGTTKQGGHTGAGTVNNGGSTTAKNNGGSTTVKNNGGSTTAKNNGGNAQNSLQLDPSVICQNCANTGLGNGSEVGQVASATSTNNFINFCIGRQITNGLQHADGSTSCNPVVIGDIPAKSLIPRVKFASPKNFATIPANTAFDVALGIQNMVTGQFVNPKTNYYAAPQQVNKQGQILGHSHIVIELLKSLQDTTVTNPQVFAFFQGLNAAAVNDKLTTTVTKGLPKGVYRISSITTAANHQPVLAPVAQHGGIDDAIYITVSDAPAKGAASSAAKPTASSPPRLSFVDLKAGPTGVPKVGGGRA